MDGGFVISDVFDNCQIESDNLYLVADEKWKTNGIEWGFNVTFLLNDELGRSIPVYTHPAIAVLLHPSPNITLWKCKARVDFANINKRVYCNKITTEHKVSVPRVSSYTRMKFGFGCVDKAFQDPTFIAWVLDWIGTSRSIDKVYEIYDYCENKIAIESKQTPLAEVARAAQWMCWAACNYTYVDNETLNRFVSQAARYANHSASINKINSYDIITIAELAMAAK